MNTNNFIYESSYGTSRQLPPSTLPEIAFAGRSNVGKSSLLNCLLRRKALARVSGTPGKTVTVLPGVPLTRARALRRSRQLSRDDFPTLDRPAKAISGRVEGGSWAEVP